ncbi:MAG: phospholipase [Thermus sp.]|uniref:alpha/beta hydrolase n=1 Tax=Thermus sp. TaxID=275 RepID=UPI00331C82AD
MNEERFFLGEIPVLLRLPKKPRGLLLALHGLQGNKEQILSLLPGYLEAGLALLAFDAPRHGPRGRPPSARDERYVEAFYRVVLGMAEEAGRVLAEVAQPLGLPLFLAGGSMGAFTLHLLLAQGLRPQAALAFIGSGLPMKPPLGYLVQDPEVKALYEAPPVFRGQAYGQTPLLHLHGSRDLIVPLSRVEEALEALRPHYPPGRLALYREEGTGHEITPLMARVGLAFLESFL